MPERTDPVHTRKQLQAFPPNFIHSLDASHMILSALECDALGLTFAAVHDSFWTHAADVDAMNRVLRDAFVRIHSEDVIGRLAAECTTRYKGAMYLHKIDKGTAMEKKISALRKKHRLSMKTELLMEKKRLDLLSSSDAELVTEGQKMVTPASIFEKMAVAEDTTDLDEVANMGLGDIPAGEKASAEALEASRVPEGEKPATTKEADENEATGPGDEPEDRLQQLFGTGTFDLVVSNSLPAKKKTSKEKTQIWLPLTLPEIPQKGDFDVRRLKSSAYFFS